MIRSWFLPLQVIEGMDIVKKVEAEPTGYQDKPKKTCMIADCGEL